LGVPSGTAELRGFFRPIRDFVVVVRKHPSHEWLGYFRGILKGFNPSPALARGGHAGRATACPTSHFIWSKIATWTPVLPVFVKNRQI